MLEVSGNIQNLVSSEAWQKIDQLEQQMVLANCPVECEITHHFTPGLYCREMHIPEGTILTSKIHLTEHPFVLSKGTLRVWDEFGGVKDLSAPFFGVTKAGTRRIGLTVSDVVWTTFHVTDETDVAKIEETIILKRIDHLCLGPQLHQQ
jgi:hypothetical protein